MKVLVTYYSQTGNTEKLARSIYEAIHVEKELLPVQDDQEHRGLRHHLRGIPRPRPQRARQALPFFKNLPDGQNIALFCTHGSLRGGHLPKQALEHAIGLASRAKILGTFGVRGKVDVKLIDALIKQAEHRAWAEEAQGACGHPNESDLADGKTFAREILAKIGR